MFWLLLLCLDKLPSLFCCCLVILSCLGWFLLWLLVLFLLKITTKLWIHNILRVQQKLNKVVRKFICGLFPKLCPLLAFELFYYFNFFLIKIVTFCHISKICHNLSLFCCLLLFISFLVCLFTLVFLLKLILFFYFDFVLNIVYFQLFCDVISCIVPKLTKLWQQTQKQNKTVW